MSFLGGAFIPFIIWLANPLYIISVIQTVKGRITGLYYSLSATILAILFSQLDSIMTSESGSTSQITSLGRGFWLWLASFAVLSLGIILNNIILNKKKP